MTFYFIDLCIDCVSDLAVVLMLGGLRRIVHVEAPRSRGLGMYDAVLIGGA